MLSEARIPWGAHISVACQRRSDTRPPARAFVARAAVRSGETAIFLCQCGSAALERLRRCPVLTIGHMSRPCTHSGDSTFGERRYSAVANSAGSHNPPRQAFGSPCSWLCPHGVVGNQHGGVEILGCMKDALRSLATRGYQKHHPIVGRFSPQAGARVPLVGRSLPRPPVTSPRSFASGIQGHYTDDAIRKALAQ